MKNGVNYNTFHRRTFLKSLLAIGLFSQVGGLVQSCQEQIKKVLFRITGMNHILGHRLWAKDFPKVTKEIEVDFLIIGAGITGLSAARQLKKSGVEDFLVVEMETTTGGNSNFGQNKYSNYPLGAHYLPLPNFEDKTLLEFLFESKIITHFENGKPIFDENQLCFDPKERLFIRNNWQEDLIPKFGLSNEAEVQFERFFALMNELKESKDDQGLYHFMLPLHMGSKSDKFKYLDDMTMKEWLLCQQLQNEDLFWYVDYCCKDDFGLGIEFVSAWAGVFYFAARKHNTSYTDSVLTWPEGNGRLKQHLEVGVKDHIKTQQLAFDVENQNDKIEVKVFDDHLQETILYKTKQLICCTPTFVSSYLFSDRKNLKSFDYAPWFTATLTLGSVDLNDSYPLCWDNVIHQGQGLGYIYNQHQSLAQVHEHKVLTYYYAFSSSNSKKVRKKLYAMKEEELKKLIFEDLNKAHPNIEQHVISVSIFKLGHGMVSPRPGFIFGEEKKRATLSNDAKIHFAHSDLSGISVFEEAFHQGVNVVNKIVNS